MSLIHRKQSKKVFYAKGTDAGKPTLLFNLHTLRSKEFNAMNISEQLTALAFLEDCKNTVQQWINELKGVI